MLAFFEANTGDVKTFDTIEAMVGDIVLEIGKQKMSMLDFYSRYEASEMLRYDINYFLYRIFTLPTTLASNGDWNGFTKCVNINQDGFDAGEYFHQIKDLFKDTANFYGINCIEIFKEEPVGHFRMRVFYAIYPLINDINKGMFTKIERCYIIDHVLEQL